MSLVNLLDCFYKKIIQTCVFVLELYFGGRENHYNIFLTNFFAYYKIICNVHIYIKESICNIQGEKR